MRATQAARKRQADREYALARNQRYVRARGRCELGAEGCTETATETHHVVKRSHHLDHSYDNLRACCHSCNQWVEHHPHEAELRGWVATDWPQL